MALVVLERKRNRFYSVLNIHNLLDFYLTRKVKLNFLNPFYRLEEPSALIFGGRGNQSF